MTPAEEMTPQPRERNYDKWRERCGLIAGILVQEMRENGRLRAELEEERAENEWLLVEVNELRATIAFEIEYEVAREERWSKHLKPKKGHAGILVKHTPISEPTGHGDAVR